MCFARSSDVVTEMCHAYSSLHRDVAMYGDFCEVAGGVMVVRRPMLKQFGALLPCSMLGISYRGLHGDDTRLSLVNKTLDVGETIANIKNGSCSN